jgi:xylose dehydrogenase (NAD/NADP)
MTKLRWGILGAARVNERLLPAIVEANNAELVAIASRRVGAAQETLAKYAPQQLGQVDCYDALEPLLQRADIDAIYIPLANHEHAHWAIQAIQAGKHVLIEKPMAIRVQDIDAIAQAAQQHQRCVMEGFMYRFHPQHQRVKQIVDSGKLGEIRFAKASYSFMMRPARMYRLANHTDLGGGAMWDIGPYAVHTLRHCFAQDPVAVMATAKYADSGADITTSGVIDFGDGRRGHFDTSFECSRQSEYTLIGTKGGLKCHTVWQLPGTNDVPVISWWCEDGSRAEEVYPASNHFVLEIEHFSAAVLQQQPPLLSLQDARMNCLTIQAIIESAVSGKQVAIHG